jgi:hypothetical protein
MFHNLLARRPIRRSSRPLVFQSLEDRLPPANNLAITQVFSSNVVFITSGSTATVKTTGPGAVVDIDDIETHLRNPAITEVVLTTEVNTGGTDGGEAGNFTWDQFSLPGNTLDFTGFGFGKTLTIRPDPASPLGQVTILGSQFGTNATGENLNITIDTSGVTSATPGAGDVRFLNTFFGGDVSFGPDVANFIVTASGIIEYQDGANAIGIDVSNHVVLTTPDTITFANTGGISAGGDLTIGGSNVTISGGSTLEAGGEVRVAGTGAIQLGGINLTAAAGPLTVTGGTVTMGSTVQAWGDLTIESGAGSTDLGFSILTSSTGNVLVTATDSVLLNGFAEANNSSSFVAGPAGQITMTGDLSVLGLGQSSIVTFSGDVEGNFDLTLNAFSSQFLGTVGATTSLNNLTLAGGELTSMGNAITAANLFIGDDSSDSFEATLDDGIGQINADVTVNSDGNITPGGVGAIGVLTIQGDLEFNGGDFALDVGASNADRIDLIGPGADLIIASGRLGNETSTGVRTAPGSVTIISFTGTQSGEFSNAPLGDAFFLNGEALQVTSYSPVVNIALADPNAGNVFAGSDDDGTGYNVKLTGPGQLVAFEDVAGLLNIVTRNTTTSSRLLATTKTNASDDLIELGQVAINGALGTFTASTADVTGSFAATGTVKSISVHDLMAGATIEGTATDRTTLKGNNLFGRFRTHGYLSSVSAAGHAGLDIIANGIGSINGQFVYGNIDAMGFLIAVPNGTIGNIVATEDFFASITAKSVKSIKASSLIGFAVDTTGTVGSLSAANGILGEVNAGSIGTVRAGGLLQSAFLNEWDVTNGVKSITAGSIQDFQMTAGFVGSISVMGNAKTHLSGDIVNSTITLTGNDGTAARNGLKTLTAKGTVRDSRFDVEEGNVGTVTVGRFINSHLHIDYTPPLSFDFPGGFDSAANFKLTKFTTTATPLNDPSSPFNFAFAGSEIAVDTIGMIRLSGLKTDNNGAAFGVKFRTAGGSVQTKAADVAMPFNTNLSPSLTALAGDFFYLDVP